MPSYELTRDAQDDLENIARYTLKQWGKSQSLRYASLLEKCCTEISEGSRLSRKVLEQYPSLRVCKCERHYVFFLIPTDSGFDTCPGPCSD